MIDLIDVFKLAPHQYGDVVIDGGSEINHQWHIARLTGVAILGGIDFSTGTNKNNVQLFPCPQSPGTHGH